MIVPFDSEAWNWADAGHGASTFAGRPSLLAGGDAAVLLDHELEDGTIELELGVGRQRGFYGVVWRDRDAENFESFYLRPHQVGNPDAVQYTPVFNGIPCWQLYHQEGFWAPVSFHSTTGSASGSCSPAVRPRSTSETSMHPRSSPG